MKCRCGTVLNKSNVAVVSITETEVVVECHNCIEPFTYERNVS